MSRFKQPERYLGQPANREAQAGAATLAAQAGAATLVEDPARKRVGPALRPVAPPPAVRTPEAEPSKVAHVGLLALCAYMIAPLVQDITTQAFHFKPYLNVISLAILVPAFFACGTAFRGLKFRTGHFWMAFLVFATLAIPFSYWPGGSASMIWGYFWRSYMVFFWLCAFAMNYAQVRIVILANVVSAMLLLIDCGLFGAMNEGGRLGIPNSFVFVNSNDLALQLLLNIGLFAYLVMQPRMLMRFAGVAGIAASLYYMLKTASRGGLLACFIFVAILIFFSRRRLVWMAASIPALAIGLALMPGSTLHRFTLVLMNPDSAEVTQQDAVSVESQIERTELMKTALKYTFIHPLFGVGPGEFMDAVWSDEHRNGKHPPALGTHNTYLEVSSECGLPAFFCYLIVVLGCIVINYRIYRRTQDRKELTDAGRMAFCLFAASAGFAVNIFFHHLAYSGYLPLLAGITVCLNAVTQLQPKLQPQFQSPSRPAR
jgi:O-antigen ligase